MAVTVKDILQLDIMKNFKIVAGKKGLNKCVSGAEILDFEFCQGIDFEGSITFNKNSIALSSLLFAKDNGSLLFEAVRKLINLNVSCLAYKPVIYKELPVEVIELADREGFCILEFGGDEYFEDVIFTIISEIRRNDKNLRIEGLIKQMLEGSLHGEKIADAAQSISSTFLENIFIINIVPTEKIKGACSENEFVKYTEKSLNPKLSQKCCTCTYKGSLFLFISGESDEKARFMATLQDLLYELIIEIGDYFIGYSQIHNTVSEFDLAVQEAYQARIVAEIESCQNVMYEKIGAYQMILADRDIKSGAGSMHRYMANCLAPIYNKKDSNSVELFNTAVSFILAKGNMDLTSEKLCCHRNTVRYRINRLQEKLGYTENSKEFFSDISLAVKVFLAEQYFARKKRLQ